VRGEVDAANADALREALELRVDQPARGVVLDLTDVRYIDSAGVQLLFRLRRRLEERSGTLHLVVPPGSPVEDTLRYADVLASLEPHATVDEAVRTSATG
jgi:anti-anti-sigma factor